MVDHSEFYKLSYLWKICDHWMGFKECVEIGRIIEHTWLEIPNRGDVFERRKIGSLGDGIEFQRRGNDDFFVFRNICVLSKETLINRFSRNKSILLAEYVDSGYCILRYITGPVFSEDLYDSNKDFQVYFSSSKFLDKCLSSTSRNARSRGPVVVNDGNNSTCALPVFGWPPVAMKWFQRDRTRCWPRPETLDKVLHDGCHCVPVGISESATKHLEWQLCFSVAECTLVHSMDHSLFKLYQILRILIHEGLNNWVECKGIVSSYMIKTLMFWMCEDNLPNFICAGNLKESIRECLTQLEEWIGKNFIPHYFIPERNLLQGNINPLHRARILKRLHNLKIGVLDELLSCRSFKPAKIIVTTELPASVDTLDFTSDDLKTMSEFAFFVNVGSGYFSNMSFSRAQRYLRNFENAYTFDTLSNLQSNAVKQIYHRVSNTAGKIVFRILQKVRFNKQRYDTLRLSEAFLKIGCSADMTSGTLSLATLYFCLKKLKKCINMTDIILRGIKPFTVYLRNLSRLSNNLNRRKLYQKVISPELSPLSSKMKRSCVADIEIIRLSFLWPAAINLEMEIIPPEWSPIHAPALVYLYFLRFLCFEVCGNETQQTEALSNLSAISYDDEHNDKSFLTYNIIGICHEHFGNYSEAVEMYGKAAKKAKKHDWMNENANPGLLRIGIVLNNIFKDEL